jgi:hypothetical protein
MKNTLDNMDSKSEWKAFSIDRQTDEKLKNLGVLYLTMETHQFFFYLSVCQWRTLESTWNVDLEREHSPKTHSQIKDF